MAQVEACVQLGRVLAKMLVDGRSSNKLRSMHPVFLRCLVATNSHEDADLGALKSVSLSFDDYHAWTGRSDFFVRLLSARTAEEVAAAIGQWEDFGDLKPGGDDIAVTVANKREYVELKINHELVGRRVQQLQAVCKGFWSSLPSSGELASVLRVLTPMDWFILLGGEELIEVTQLLQLLDFEDWGDSPTPAHLRSVLQSASQTQLRKFIKFVTGADSLPLPPIRGHVRIKVEKVGGGLQRLPEAHTCFYQLDLPDYCSLSELRTKLLEQAVEATSFHLA